MVSKLILLLIKSRKGISSILIVTIIMSIMNSCKHEPLEPVQINAVITDPGGEGSGIPCDSNTIYFEQQILPFLISSCAKIGCHDNITHEENVILNSYQNVISTGEVTPFDLGDSEIWEVITDGDPDDRMPPPGENPLTQDQINLIAQWINQGALNLFCDDLLGPCDSTSVSYSLNIRTILDSKCIGCHGSATGVNAFVNLATYSGVNMVATSGQLLGSITHNSNYTAMPYNGPMLNTCEIAKIRTWVANGSPNN